MAPAGRPWKRGAVGRIPRYMRNIITTRIVKFDVEHEVPIRGADGWTLRRRGEQDRSGATLKELL